MKKIVKMFIRSKTLLFNAALGIVGAIEIYSGNLQGLFSSQESFGVFMVIVGGIGSALRFVTTSSLMEKVGDDL